MQTVGEEGTEKSNSWHPQKDLLAIVVISFGVETRIIMSLSICWHVHSMVEFQRRENYHFLKGFRSMEKLQQCMHTMSSHEQDLVSKQHVT